MISDVLHDACSDLLEYLEESWKSHKSYMNDKKDDEWIVSVFVQMNALRHYLDHYNDDCDKLFNADFFAKFRQAKTLQDLDKLGVVWKK